MRYIILFIHCFFLTQFSFGQTKDIWVRFYDTTTRLNGYKDVKGNIKIPAKFANHTRADSFYNIIAVEEVVDSSYKSYYLLKDGRKVGLDSVFIFDFTFDCEREGKILFKDKKKDKVGFFDKNGVVIIPAIYNAASPFRNGLAIALKNAKRQCWDKNEDTLNCEHLSWSGGEMVLINDKNETLIDSLKADLCNINWYSLKVNEPGIDTSIWISVKGNNSNIYSFVNYEKEFAKWFNSIFIIALKAPGSKAFRELLFPQITFYNENGWTSLSNDKFLKTFPASITKERFHETFFKKLSISDEDLNSIIFDENKYQLFFNACGAHNKEKFPLFEVMLTYHKKRIKEFKLTPPPPGIKSEEWKLSDFDKKYEIDYQEHFEFIRTNEGYKLLSASWKH